VIVSIETSVILKEAWVMPGFLLYLVILFFGRLQVCVHLILLSISENWSQFQETRRHNSA